MPAPHDDSLGAGIFKTGMSMLVSMAVYAVLFGDIQLAIGFVLLMLIHEMGHVIALNITAWPAVRRCSFRSWGGDQSPLAAEGRRTGSRHRHRRPGAGNGGRWRVMAWRM